MALVNTTPPLMPCPREEGSPDGRRQSHCRRRRQQQDLQRLDLSPGDDTRGSPTLDQYFASLQLQHWEALLQTQNEDSGLVGQQQQQQYPVASQSQSLVLIPDPARSPPCTMHKSLSKKRGQRQRQRQRHSDTSLLPPRKPLSSIRGARVPPSWDGAIAAASAARGSIHAQSIFNGGTADQIGAFDRWSVGMLTDTHTGISSIEDVGGGSADALPPLPARRKTSTDRISSVSSTTSTSSAGSFISMDDYYVDYVSNTISPTNGSPVDTDASRLPGTDRIDSIRVADASTSDSRDSSGAEQDKLRKDSSSNSSSSSDDKSSSIAAQNLTVFSPYDRRRQLRRYRSMEDVSQRQDVAPMLPQPTVSPFPRRQRLVLPPSLARLPYAEAGTTMAAATGVGDSCSDDETGA